MIIFFVLGFFFAAFDLLVGGVDVLPDIFGFVLLAVCFFLLNRRRCLTSASVIFGSAALVCCLVVLFSVSDRLAFFFRILENLFFFLAMLPVFSGIFPTTDRKSTEFTLRRCLSTGMFFICLTRIFSGLLNIWTVTRLATFILQLLIILFTLIILCRYWTRLINNPY